MAEDKNNGKISAELVPNIGYETASAEPSTVREEVGAKMEAVKESLKLTEKGKKVDNPEKQGKENEL